MCRTVSLAVLCLFTGVAFGVVGSQQLDAQQQPIKRTDLLKVELPDMKDTEMHVWLGDVAPNARPPLQSEGRRDGVRPGWQ